MDGKAGMTGFGAVTVLLVLVTALLCVEAAICGMDMNAGRVEKYYREKERELADDVRVILRKKGFGDSGIMVTCVTLPDGSRSYTVCVHHKDIDSMSEDERQQLLRQLEALSLEGEGYTVSHRFLLND